MAPSPPANVKTTTSTKARHGRTTSFGDPFGTDDALGGGGGGIGGGGGGVLGGSVGAVHPALVDRGAVGPAALAKTTPLQSAFNLMNSITGLGLLGIPFCFRECGALLAMVGLYSCVCCTAVASS
jgi:hypothetical protein